MEFTGEASRVCQRTGLVVVNQPDVALRRVFKTADGPLNPPIRSGRPDERWGRFDLPGVATMYGATHSRGAYVETLAALAPADVDYAELFDDVAPGEDPVTQDWSDMHHMPPGQYIDVMAGDPISALRRHFTKWAPNQDPAHQRIDTSVLTGPDCVVTCAVAKWLGEQVLADGSIPAGIRYVSRHGGELPCWAVWVDLGGSNAVVDGRAVEQPQADAAVRRDLAQGLEDRQGCLLVVGDDERADVECMHPCAG